MLPTIKTQKIMCDIIKDRGEIIRLLGGLIEKTIDVNGFASPEIQKEFELLSMTMASKDLTFTCPGCPHEEKGEQQ